MHKKIKLNKEIICQFSATVVVNSAPNYMCLHFKQFEYNLGNK